MLSSTIFAELSISSFSSTPSAYQLGIWFIEFDLFAAGMGSQFAA